MANATVILDFDGTVALGDGPLHAYARAIAAQSDQPGLGESLATVLDEFARGSSDAADGYGAIAEAAHAAGVGQLQLSDAYHASRSELGTDNAPVDLPAGFAAFLERIAGTDVWLATNAPATGIVPLLEDAGVAHLISRLAFDLGKPDGLRPLLVEALDTGPVLSVGDVYRNDLEPAVELGAATALVGANAHRDPHEVTMRGSSLNALYPAIEAWIANAANSQRTSPEAQIPQSKET